MNYRNMTQGELDDVRRAVTSEINYRLQKWPEEKSDVVIGHFETVLPIPADRICDAAKAANLKLCIIVGVEKNGDFYFASSDADLGMVLWQLERAKKRLFEING